MSIFQSVRRLMKLECKCHGVSGSCTVRTCWQAMHKFRRVGSHLRDKYDGATQVTVGQDGDKLTVVNQNHKRHTRSDLIYFEQSPDYCVRDPNTGQCHLCFMFYCVFI